MTSARNLFFLYEAKSLPVSGCSNEKAAGGDACRFRFRPVRPWSGQGRTVMVSTLLRPFCLAR